MSLLYIVDGDFGQVVKLTFVDVDTGLAADISGYTSSQKMIFTAPDGTVTEKTAAFDDDGSDGIIKYTTESGFLTAGHWKVRGRVTAGSAQLTTVQHSFKVIV